MLCYKQWEMLRFFLRYLFSTFEFTDLCYKQGGMLPVFLGNISTFNFTNFALRHGEMLPVFSEKTGSMSPCRNAKFVKLNVEKRFREKRAAFPPVCNTNL